MSQNSLTRGHTVKETKLRLFRAILERDVPGLVQWHRDALERAVKTGDEQECGDYFEFCREAAGRQIEVTLTVRFDADWDSKSEKAEDGSSWRAYKARVEMSWPSYGGQSLAFAEGHAALLRDVMALANELEAMIPVNLVKCVRTAEEAKEDEARKEAARLGEKAAQVVEAFGSGIRRGVTVTGVLVNDLPVGSYTVLVGKGTKKKMYSVVVPGGEVPAYLTRTV